ncbi:MAG: VWA domain-containing protein [Alicyclobacillus sp.]|nr:VWA domain-containing protein [Alicyclobacillus sp.]
MAERPATDKQATIRQILVITDGFSNVGEDPVAVAQEARRKGIVVNVIGVVDGGDLGRQGKQEALSIADAGGGMCRVVQPSDLSATAQMMTHQTMQMTLQQVVGRELMQAMGKQVEDLPPDDRARVAQVVDKLEDVLRLELVAAVDTSASMRDKMPMVREALRDLSLSLQAREGTSMVAIVRFPGTTDDAPFEVVSDFSPELDLGPLERIFVARGGTPTGPALRASIELFDGLAKRARPGTGVAGPESDLPDLRRDGTAP